MMRSNPPKSHTTCVAELIKQFLQKVIDLVNDIPIEKDHENRKVLIVCHLFVHELQDVADKLQVIVIQSFKTGHTQPGLSKIISNLSSSLNSIQQTYTCEASVLKTQLIRALQELAPEALVLQNYVESDPNGAFASDVGTILVDLLFALETIYYFNDIDTKTREELLELIRDFENHMLTLSTKIDVNDPGAKMEFINLIRYTVHKMCLIRLIIDAEAMRHDTNVRFKLLQISQNMNVDLGMFDAYLCGLCKTGTISSISESFKIVTNTCHNQMLSLALIENPTSPDLRTAVNLNTMVIRSSSIHRAAIGHFIEIIKVISPS